VINAWADQMGLAGASRVVVTRSGFSRWAIEIGLLGAESVRKLRPDIENLVVRRNFTFQFATLYATIFCGTVKLTIQDQLDGIAHRPAMGTAL